MDVGVTRRGFLGALAAGLGGLALGRIPQLPALKEEVVLLDWIRCLKRQGEALWTVEARYRVSGGKWITRAVRSKECGMWLTPRVGVSFPAASRMVEGDVMDDFWSGAGNPYIQLSGPVQTV